MVWAFLVLFIVFSLTLTFYMAKGIYIASFLFFQVLVLFSQQKAESPLLEGLKIAFVSYRTGSAEIYLMNSDGSALEQLTNSPENNSFPIQLDNRTLGFNRTDSLRNTTSYQIDIYTKEESVYNELPIRPGAKWQVENPENQHWAFIRSNDYKDRELFIYNANTGFEKQLTSFKNPEFATYSVNHSWSPDGKSLVFMSGKDWYNQVIRLYNLETGLIKQVTERGYMNSGLKWLNDGINIIANLKIKDKTHYELYSVNSETGDLNQLTKGINLHPDVSPDGEWIVFESQRHNNDGEVYIMKKDGTQQLRLTNNPNYNGRPVWIKL